MDNGDEKPISPIGQTARKAASARYESDAAYREAHDQLAPYRAIARAVILARVARHMTQRDLAAMLGTTDSAVSRIESGGRAISLETLRKLGVALDLVFLVGSNEAAKAIVSDPRAVIVPETPADQAPVQATGTRLCATAGSRIAISETPMP
jgi:transcriptional regulator with XRE-family HTH domain